jgi:hypothetical protein
VKIAKSNGIKIEPIAILEKKTQKTRANNDLKQIP